MKKLTSFFQISFIKRYYFAFLYILIANALLVLSIIMYANKEVTTSNQKAITEVNDNLTRIRGAFDYLVNNNTLSSSCDELLIKLRQGVFNTRMVKEVAVFGSDSRFFCSSNKGKVSFSLYPQYRRALVDNYPKPTLSYLKAAIIRSHALSLMFMDENKRGVSVLIPPSYLFQIVNKSSQNEHLYFEITISGQKLQAFSQEIPKVIKSHSDFSDALPFSVTTRVGYAYYADYLLSTIWLNLLLTSLIITAYVMAQRHMISKNSLEFAFTDALRKGYFECHYQPIYKASTQEIIGCEALLRWNDPIRGFVSPGIFIPLAEKLNLIDRLTSIVIDLTMSLIRQNRSAFQGKYVSINISRRSLIKGTVVNWVEMLQERYPELLHHLVFEITENGEFDEADMACAKRSLNMIEKAGIRIAIDDFGTGYSGLDFIAQLPFSIMKIDRVFVNNLTNESAIIPVLDSMLALATHRRMTVIVEGVESKQQLDILQEVGFDFIQGFYFDRPMPPVELLKKISGEETRETEPSLGMV